VASWYSIDKRARPAQCRGEAKLEGGIELDEDDDDDDDDGDGIAQWQVGALFSSRRRSRDARRGYHKGFGTRDRMRRGEAGENEFHYYLRSKK
jgi:hypothetical protein